MKRAVPFLLTFLVGVLIAGIFVPFGNFQFRKNRWNKHREYQQRLETENQQLREELERLRKQLSKTEDQILTEELDVPPPPVPPLVPKVKTAEKKVKKVEIRQ